MTGAEIAVRDGYSLSEIKGIATYFAQSGFFNDARDVAKAFTKVLAGRELGIGPMTAMTQIHVIKGKTALSATLVGSQIKKSSRYDYRVQTLTDEVCELVFFEDGEKVGESSFSLEDAKVAGLLGNETYKKFPRNMLLSRALTNGARWYCPDVFGGAIYTPDELGAAVDVETGEFIEGVATEVPDPADERAASRAEEEGPRSPTPAAGGSADEAPGMGARTPEPTPSDDVAAEESVTPPATASSESGPSSPPEAEAESGADASSQEAEAGSAATSEESDPKITQAERKQLFAKAREKLSEADFKKLVYSVTQKTSTSEMTKSQLAQILEAIETWSPEGETVDGEATEVSE